MEMALVLKWPKMASETENWTQTSGWDFVVDMYATTIRLLMKKEVWDLTSI